MKNILLIEFNNFHEEVILSQLDLLKNSKYKAYLYINEKVKNKNLKFPIDRIYYIKSSNKFIKLLGILNILKDIYFNKIDIVIYNTLEDRYVKLLNKFIPKKVKKIGIIHNVDKFESNKLDLNNFLVLSENIFNNIAEKHKYKFSYFYPLIFNQIESKTKEKTEKINIVIPGLVEFTRRDYIGLLDILKDNTLKNINFIILGNIAKLDGPKVLSKIKEYKLENIFKVYDGFIPYDEYFNILKSADLIMPLIHPNIENFEKYHTTKITASFSMAFTFKVPLFIFESLHNLDEFKKFSIGYNIDNCIEKLQNLSKNGIKELKNNIQLEKKFSYSTQQKKYINILENLK
jgi:hypothetical protein